MRERVVVLLGERAGNEEVAPVMAERVVVLLGERVENPTSR
jgi:hypothetical protein